MIHDPALCNWIRLCLGLSLRVGCDGGALQEIWELGICNTHRRDARETRHFVFSHPSHWLLVIQCFSLQKLTEEKPPTAPGEMPALCGCWDAFCQGCITPSCCLILLAPGLWFQGWAEAWELLHPSAATRSRKHHLLSCTLGNSPLKMRLW